MIKMKDFKCKFHKKRLLIEMSTKKRVFSCPECGYPYEAYPPDDFHPTVSLEKPKDARGTVIKIIHDCKQCKYPITLYWYSMKMDFRM